MRVDQWVALIFVQQGATGKTVLASVVLVYTSYLDVVCVVRMQAQVVVELKLPNPELLQGSITDELVVFGVEN